MDKKKRIKGKLIQFWVTENQHERAKDKADYCGLSMSELMRTYIDDGIVIKRDFKDVFYELNKIGVNINQVARKVNEKDSVNGKDIDELRIQYEKMFELYYEKFING